MKAKETSYYHEKPFLLNIRILNAIYREKRYQTTPDDQNMHIHTQYIIPNLQTSIQIYNVHT